MKKLFFFIVTFSAFIGAKAQQDPLYSSYMQNPLLINPAYTGTYNMFSSTAIARQQWVGMKGAPITNSLSAHSAIHKNKLGAGVILVNDNFGINNNFEGYGTFSYKINLGEKEENVLSFGMQAGLMSYRFDYESKSLEIKHTDDPNFKGASRTASEPNFGAGVFYRNEKLFAGFSAPKILNSRLDEGSISTSQYKRHYFFTGGYLFDMIDFQVKPSFLVRYVEGAPVSFDINTSVLMKDLIWLGGSLRFSPLGLNSAVVMAQLQLNDNFRLGYSLDIPVSRLIRTNYGSHEIMLSIDLKLLKGHDIGLRYF